MNNSAIYNTLKYIYSNTIYSDVKILKSQAGGVFQMTTDNTVIQYTLFPDLNRSPTGKKNGRFKYNSFDSIVFDVFSNNQEINGVFVSGCDTCQKIINLLKLKTVEDYNYIRQNFDVFDFRFGRADPIPTMVESRYKDRMQITLTYTYEYIEDFIPSPYPIVKGEITGKIGNLDSEIKFNTE